MNFVTVKPCCILTEIIGLFAEGFLPFPGKVEYWDCGITFDIFTHTSCTGHFFFFIFNNK